MDEIDTSLHTVNPNINVAISNIAPRGDDEIFDINHQKYNVTGVAISSNCMKIQFLFQRHNFNAQTYCQKPSNKRL